MSIHGDSDNAMTGFPPIVQMRGEGSEAGYRQDDAPPSARPADGASAPGGEVRAAAPGRDIAEILDTLRATPFELARLIEDKSDEQLAQPASDGEWGVVEILPHLRDWEEVYLDWIRELLEADTPALEVVDDSLWAIEHDYANEPTRDALAAFRETRDDVVQLLEEIAAEAWSRRAIHPQVGELTLHQLADRMCDHDARHIEQARDALT